MDTPHFSITSFYRILVEFLRIYVIRVNPIELNGTYFWVFTNICISLCCWYVCNAPGKPAHVIVKILLLNLSNFNLKSVYSAPHPLETRAALKLAVQALKNNLLQVRSRVPNPIEILIPYAGVLCLCSVSREIVNILLPRDQAHLQICGVWFRLPAASVILQPRWKL